MFHATPHALFHLRALYQHQSCDIKTTSGNKINNFIEVSH
ncbi:unnamed protein product [Gemmata massiliana]|uniref:Uncharacterized protein n=1 Tax=Gemmata massiliana TaxID=1210884 RepID=A0A6P2DL34_9BACT|nr:unnamed protein product [Gemmata massiliana]